MNANADRYLINGNELLDGTPTFALPMRAPVIHLANDLMLDDSVLCSPLAILGAVGTGKTELIYQITDVIADHAEHAGDSVIIFCAKPAMFDRYYCPGDIVIRADAISPESCWNIFEELRASSNADLTLRDMVTDLFDDQSSTLQPFYTLAPSDILRIVIDFMYHWGLDHDEVYDNAQLVDFLINTPVCGDGDNTLGWLDYADRYPEFSPLRDYLGTGGSDQALGIISELRVLLSSTLYGTFAQPNGTFSAIRSIKEGRKRIFLFYDYAQSSYSALKVFKLLVNLMLKQSMSSENNGKVWFIADEFSLLPKLKLTEPLSLGREYGFRMICTLQSAELLTKSYGTEGAKRLLSLFPNIIALRISDPLNRSVLADRYGKAHYLYSFISDDGKDHALDAVEPVISDGDFSRIVKKGNGIISMPDISSHPFIYHGNRGESS